MPRNELDYFLNRVHQAYVEARRPLCADELCGLTIERGRSRTISGIAEDYFAELLYKEIDKDGLHFFVDQPLVGGTHKVYPDVIIARPHATKSDCFDILYMLDLKMDVGYHRDITAGKRPTLTYIEKAGNLIKDLALLRDAPELSTKSGSKKKSRTDRSAPRYYFSMHPQSSYDEVIITSKNAGNKTKEQELIERAKDPNCNIWVLSTGDHPNEYGDDVKMCPLDESWEILLQKIRNILE